MADRERAEAEGAAAAQPQMPYLERRVSDLFIRLALLGLFIYAAYTIVSPFLSIIVWAVILAVALYPVFVWLGGLLGGRGRLAAGLITLLGLVILLGPAAALAFSLGESVTLFFQSLQDGSVAVPPPPDWAGELPLIGEPLHRLWAQASDNLEATLSDNSEEILAAGKVVVGQIAGVGLGILMFAASVLIAGFLLTSANGFLANAHVLSVRLAGQEGADYLDLAGATIRNVSRGVIGVAVLQALLAGIVMFVAGVPAAGVVAAITLLLCIVQIGPGLTILPAIVWAWTTMDTTAAVIFTAVMIPIMLIDNVLKPILMARGLTTPMIVILLGVIGGTLSLGLLGLFIGPIVLAVFYEILVAWMRAGAPRPA